MTHIVGTILVGAGLVLGSSTGVYAFCAYASCRKHADPERQWIDFHYPRISALGLLASLIAVVGLSMRSCGT